MPDCSCGGLSGRTGPDQIEVRALRLLGRHGLLPEERQRSQPFEVDVDLWADLRAAGENDDLARTVDYGAVCEAVRAVVEGKHRALLESVAEAAAAQVLAVAGNRARAVAVTVRKLRPPLPYDLASAGVRVFREAGQAPFQAPGHG